MTFDQISLHRVNRDERQKMVCERSVMFGWLLALCFVYGPATARGQTSSDPTARPRGATYILVENVPYYLKAPKQASRPDGALTTGTTVTMIRESKNLAVQTKTARGYARTYSSTLRRSSRRPSAISSGVAWQEQLFLRRANQPTGRSLPTKSCFSQHRRILWTRASRLYPRSISR
jgi:hypothetical protein